MPKIIEVPNYGQVEFPDGMSDAEIESAIRNNMMRPAEPSFIEDASIKAINLRNQLKKGALDVLAGGVRGAGSIGSTILAPLDYAGLTGMTNEQRRKAIDEGLRELGADTEGTPYQTGKLAAEIAGTAGIGGTLAKGVTAASQSPRALALAEALRTGGMSAAGGGMGTRIAGGALSGGAMTGAINPEDAATGALIGGALPGVVKVAGEAGKAIASPFKASPEVAALAVKAKNLGIDIPADRLISSRPINAAASSLNYVPFSGRAATEEKMVGQLNKALSRTFGQNTENINQALKQADVALGNAFDTTLKSNAVKVDQQLLADLAKNLAQARNELTDDAFKIIEKQVNDIISKGASGSIEGQTAYNIKKTLDRIGKRTSNESWYSGQVKESLMSALNRSLGPKKAAEFANVRKQYSNMLKIEPLAPSGAEGNITAGRLANLRDIRTPELQDVADIAKQFVVTRESPHGAAQRVTLGALGGALGVGTGTLPLIGAGMATGRAANTALNSEIMRNIMLGNPQNLGLLKMLENPAARGLLYSVPSR